MKTRREQLYRKWRDRLQQAHREALAECFGASTLYPIDEGSGPLTRQLDAMYDALTSPEGFEASLSYAERLRLWRLDHLTLSPGGRDVVLERVDEALEVLGAREEPVLQEPEPDGEP